MVSDPISALIFLDRDFFIRSRNQPQYYASCHSRHRRWPQYPIWVCEFIGIDFLAEKERKQQYTEYFPHDYASYRGNEHSDPEGSPLSIPEERQHGSADS